MLFGAISQGVEDHAGLDAGGFARGIELENLVHIFTEIENDGNVATLAGKTGARTTGEDGRSELAARRRGGDYVGVIARDYEADGNVAIIGGVGGVEGAGAGVEADFAAHGAPQLAFESGS